MHKYLNIHYITYHVNKMNEDMGESSFLKLIGGSPTAKVLDFMLTGREFDYSKREIAENASISYNTLNAVWKQLLADAILVKTRRIGKQDMFKLNGDSRSVKMLMAFFDSLVKGNLESMQKETAKAVAME